jgi:hypothetical protein
VATAAAKVWLIFMFLAPYRHFEVTLGQCELRMFVPHAIKQKVIFYRRNVCDGQRQPACSRLVHGTLPGYAGRMVLILRPRTDVAMLDAYQVMSGDATVGVIHFATVPPGPGLWMWSITNFHVHPIERGPGNGLAATREEAMRDFAERWRCWLEWAALQVVRVPSEE